MEYLKRAGGVSDFGYGRLCDKIVRITAIAIGLHAADYLSDPFSDDLITRVECKMKFSALAVYSPHEKEMRITFDDWGLNTGERAAIGRRLRFSALEQRDSEVISVGIASFGGSTGKIQTELTGLSNPFDERNVPILPVKITDLETQDSRVLSPLKCGETYRVKVVIPTP